MARPFRLPVGNEESPDYYDDWLRQIFDLLCFIIRGRGRRRLPEPEIRRRAASVRSHHLPDVVMDTMIVGSHHHDNALLCFQLVQSVDKLSTCCYDVGWQLHLLPDSFHCRLQHDAQKARLAGTYPLVRALCAVARLFPERYSHPMCWTVLALYMGWRFMCSR